MVPADLTAESWTSSILSEAQQDKGTTAARFFLLEVLDTHGFELEELIPPWNAYRQQQQLKLPHRSEHAKGRWQWWCLRAGRISHPRHKMAAVGVGLPEASGTSPRPTALCIRGPGPAASSTNLRGRSNTANNQSKVQLFTSPVQSPLLF